MIALLPDKLPCSLIADQFNVLAPSPAISLRLALVALPYPPRTSSEVFELFTS